MFGLHVLCKDVDNYSHIQEIVVLLAQIFLYLVVFIMLRHTSFHLFFFIAISESAKLAQVSGDIPSLLPCSVCRGSSCAYELHQLVVFEIMLSEYN